MTTEKFLQLTELAGSEISEEQLQRMVNRYAWAAEYCADKDVLEVACGSGPGLRMLATRARSLSAGDYSPEVLSHAKLVVDGDVDFKCFDAKEIPYPEASFDVVLLFEALYYVAEPERFFAEARRLLRPGGKLLIAVANKDLYDFNPSPHSYFYLGVVELGERLAAAGFRVEFLGDTPTTSISLRQRVLRPIKALAVEFQLMPKTNDSKLWLKRLVFGKMVAMPASIDETTREPIRPSLIPSDKADRLHKVIFCVGTVVK